jgi:hypothetical protein
MNLLRKIERAGWKSANLKLLPWRSKWMSGDPCKLVLERILDIQKYWVSYIAMAWENKAAIVPVFTEIAVYSMKISLIHNLVRERSYPWQEPVSKGTGPGPAMQHMTRTSTLKSPDGLTWGGGWKNISQVFFFFGGGPGVWTWNLTLARQTL